MSQPWQPQPQYNPGNQPPMPQQPPGPPPGFGAPPPAQGQFPPQPGYPHQAYPAPYGQQQPQSGKPVAAFFLGLLVSVVVAAIYSLVMYATYKDASSNTAMTMYVVHALLNGAAVGAVVGLLAHGRVGAHIGGAVVAMLGTFFGYTNGVVLIYIDAGGLNGFTDMLAFDPYIPAQNWWGSGTDSVHSLLGLLAGAAAAWGLAFVIGRNRR